MKGIAGAFSAMVLLVVVAALALIIWTRPAPVVLTPLVGQIDRITVEKSTRKMRVFQAGQVVREYTIALGFSPEGDKNRQGDGRTPEGLFRINRRNESSAYHLSLGIDYPREEDRARAAAGGYDPGGDIFFHGQPNALPDETMLRGDWTAGCLALSNAEMRELWEVVPIGTEVEILP
jgi:murein L,D-transpeptidase YafK